MSDLNSSVFVLHTQKGELRVYLTVVIYKILHHF